MVAYALSCDAARPVVVEMACTWKFTHCVNTTSVIPNDQKGNNRRQRTHASVDSLVVGGVVVIREVAT